MVATTAPLPNIKELFCPNPGWVICDSDLAQADAQVVAWDAGDQALKDIFLDPDKDLHDENALTIFGRCDGIWRKRAKAGVHAVNYGVKAATLARTLGISKYDAEAFINTWFTAHPEIYEWQQRIWTDLTTTRTIQNRFGFRKIFFDRINPHTTLSEALAWIPQSTVAEVINRAWDNIEELVLRIPPRQLEVLLQVHDSLVYQIKRDAFAEILPEVKKCFVVPIPYDDPLVIPADVAVSPISWGKVQNCGWDVTKARI